MHMVALIVILFFAPAGAMDFIDGHGQLFSMSTEQKNTFLASDLGVQLKPDIEAGNKIDLSAMSHLRVSGKSLLQVLDYASDPKLLTSKQCDVEEIELLEVANFVGVNKQLLYHLANRIWGYLKTGKQTKEFQLSESKEVYIRNIAKFYLNSPERLMQINERWFFGERKNGFTCFDLSFKKLQQSYDQEYPFALSYGLANLIHNLCISAYSWSNLDHKIDIDLSGHAIKEFIIDDWIKKESDDNSKQSPKITVHLNVAHNDVERIVWSKMPSNLVYEKLDFSYNPLASLDESIYMIAYSYRSKGLTSKLIIPHHKLSMHEVALAKQQWYLAVNTLVDRYSKGHNPEGLGVLAGLLVTIGAALTDCATQSNGSILLLAGLGGGMASWLTLHFRYLPRLAHMMAIQTHPDIERSRADFHRPFGNAWLEDWQKPHLILKDENDEA